MANDGGSPYDKIVDMIKKLDLQDDGILMNRKIKSIEQDFCTIVLDENMLSESMDYINERVLFDSDDAALKFALLFSSRNFDSLAMKETKVRYKMLNILQNNFLNAEQYRKEDKNVLYNSITLLGEYYHRVRLADGCPISILGESLLELLTNELCRDLNDSEPQVIGTRLAKLILSQITLNGSIMRSKHREELDVVLYHIRRNLIEIPNLQPNVKALLLMALDLYYSHFSSLDENLENMYTRYLIAEESENENKSNIENNGPTQSSNQINNENNHSGDVGGDEKFDDSFEVCDIMKTKWSDEVSNNISISQPSENEHCDNNNGQQSLSVNNDEINNINSYRSLDHQPSQDRMSSSSRNDQCIYNNHSNSGNEDDRHSVRSEGGSIRLYNVNDRLKHVQRSNNNLSNNNRPNNSNWERNYHTFDRNRRSSSRSSNQYENNCHNKNRNYNNTYRPPPRFSNNEHWRNINNNNHNNNANNPNENNNFNNRQNFRAQESNSRSSSRSRNFSRQQHSNNHRNNLNRNNFENNSHYQQQKQHHNGRSLSPEMSSKQLYNNSNLNKPFNRNNNNFNNQQQSQPNRQQSRNFSHNRNNRYGSHNSLTASESGTWEKRGRRNHQRGKSQDYFHRDDTQSVRDQSVENWDNLGESTEIVKNARDTTEYMKYLSKK